MCAWSPLCRDGIVVIKFTKSRKLPRRFLNGLLMFRYAPFKGSDVRDFSVDEPKEGGVVPMGPPAATKVLAGAYGGLFRFTTCHTSIGSIYSLYCSDGSHATDMSDM